MGCSFIPEILTNDYVHNQCNEHDAVYRDLNSKFWDKIRADIKLGFNVSSQGFLTFVEGIWFFILGLLMGFFTLFFGWWAWRWRQGK